MNILKHQRKIVRFVQCDGFPIFEEDRKVSFKQTEDPQFLINKLLGVSPELFKKHFKDDFSDISEGQARINKMLGIDPKTFSKYFK